MMQKMIQQLILASTSPYRKSLLGRLGVPFETISPEVDEHALPGETAGQLSLRLARAKALAVFEKRPDSFVIGSDQVALLNGTLLGKPGTEEKALEQLMSMSDQEVFFETSVALASPGASLRSGTVRTAVKMRKLDEALCRAYIRREHPLNCAGSAKIESLGIALVERVSSDDPTALIGLPLIMVTDFLLKAGFKIL